MQRPVSSVIDAAAAAAAALIAVLVARRRTSDVIDFVTSGDDEHSGLVLISLLRVRHRSLAAWLDDDSAVVGFGCDDVIDDVAGDAHCRVLIGYVRVHGVVDLVAAAGRVPPIVVSVSDVCIVGLPAVGNDGGGFDDVTPAGFEHRPVFVAAAVELAASTAKAAQPSKHMAGLVGHVSAKSANIFVDEPEEGSHDAAELSDGEQRQRNADDRVDYGRQPTERGLWCDVTVSCNSGVDVT